MNKSKGNRSIIFDLLRILLITLVLNIHIKLLITQNQDLLSTLELYAVPMFLCLSFYLTAKYYIDDTHIQISIKKRINRLMIPLIFWSIIGFLVTPEKFTLKDLILQLFTGSVVNRPLYFLNMLILFTVIARIISFLQLKKRLIIYFLIIILAFELQYTSINYSFFLHQSMNIKYSYGRFIELIPYVSVGILFSKYKNILIKGKIAPILLIFISLIGFINAPQLSNSYSYGGLNLFLGTIIFFTVIIIINNHYRNSNLFWITKIGEYSFGVYLMHFPLLQLFLNVIPNIKNIVIYNPILFLIGFTTLCFILCLLFDILTKKKFTYLIK